jgi:hypothetical protein
MVNYREKIVSSNEFTKIGCTYFFGSNNNGEDEESH